MRIIRWLIPIVKRPWNRADVSKTSVNEDHEYTYYNTLFFELQGIVVIFFIVSLIWFNSLID